MRCVATWVLILTVAGRASAGDPSELGARGEALLGQGRLSDAETALLAAVETAPGDARAWGLLATVCNGLSKYAEGRAACEHALALDPSDVRARFDLGVALFNLDCSAEAAVAFDAVIAADPRHADATWMRGHCALRANDLDRAAGLFRKAAELDPLRYAALGPLYAGFAASAAGEKEEAAARFDEALQVSPGGVVGVLAQGCRERLSDPTPCETLLRLEDYLLVPGQRVETRGLDLLLAPSGSPCTRVVLDERLSVMVEGPSTGISGRAFLQAIDLLAIHGRGERAAGALLLPGATPNGPLLLLDRGHDAPPAVCAPYVQALHALRMLLEAAALGREGDEAAIAAALDRHHEIVDAARKASLWGDLVEASKADAEAKGSDSTPEALRWLHVIARLSEASPGDDAARASYLRAASDAYHAGAYSLAALLYRMALRGDPSRSDAQAGLAAALARDGRYEASLAALQGVEGANLEVGRSLLMAGEYDEAAERLSTLAPSWEVAEMIGLCRLWRGRWGEAAESFRAAIVANPARAAFHRFHLGLALHAGGDRVGARAEWRECAQAAPESMYGALAQGLSTTRAELVSRRKVAVDAATAAVDKLSRGWGALARIEALPQHEAAAALLKWLEAARKRGGELGSALGAELTDARRAACGTSAANNLLDEALRQARDDVREAKGEEALAAAARERLLEVMKRCLSPQK